MQKIQLITDAGSDLRPDMLGEKNIIVLPIMVTRNDNVEFDANTMDIEQMYKDIRHGFWFSTSQVNLDLYIQSFTKCAKEKVPVIYVALSSKLSSTMQTSEMAKRIVLNDYPDAVIEIIDSKSATDGYGHIVACAYEMTERGADFNEVTDYIKNTLVHIEHIFTVSELESLYRGGRLSRIAYEIANTLNIKPILEIGGDGSIVVSEKVRGDKQLKKRIISIIKKRMGTAKSKTLFIRHTHTPQAVEEIIGLIGREKLFDEIHTEYIGAAIGAHLGVGMMGFIFYNPNKNE